MRVADPDTANLNRPPELPLEAQIRAALPATREAIRKLMERKADNGW